MKFIFKVTRVFVGLVLVLAAGTLAVTYFVNDTQKADEVESSATTVQKHESHQIKARVLSREFDDKDIPNRVEIMLSTSDFESAIIEIERYFSFLSKEQKLKIKDNYAKALQEKVKPIPTNDYASNLNIYEKLAALRPEDKNIIFKYEHYKKAVNWLDSVKSNFSNWDGSYKPLVDYVKKNMKNPDSFEHEKTSFNIQKDSIVIFMHYLGTNSFNAKIKETIKLKISQDGSQQIIE
jgi:hypothetical protein